jgi:hypothetical protein
MPHQKSFVARLTPNQRKAFARCQHLGLCVSLRIDPSGLYIQDNGAMAKYRPAILWALELRNSGAHKFQEVTAPQPMGIDGHWNLESRCQSI